MLLVLAWHIAYPCRANLALLARSSEEELGSDMAPDASRSSLDTLAEQETETRGV